MQGWVYILLLNKQKHYIGSTKDIKRRLREHENNKVLSTRSRNPKPLLIKMYSSYSDARKQELHLKKQKTKKAIMQFIVKSSIISISKT